VAEPPDIEVAPSTQVEALVRIREVNWRELALAGELETSAEWHQRLLRSALLVESPRAAANADLVEGDPRRSIARVHSLHRELVGAEVIYEELKNPGPWNSGGVRLGGTAIFGLLLIVYFTGLAHHGPVAAASLLCLVAVGFMWGDILLRRKRAAAQWQHRNQVRDRLREAARRLGTRSWVAPIGGEVMENTPHLDLLSDWIREVRQHLLPWRRKLEGMVPLDEVDGIPEALMEEADTEVDEAAAALARTKIEALTEVLEKLEAVRERLEKTRQDQRDVAAEGALPAQEGLDFDLDEARAWLRKAALDPDRSGVSTQEWLERPPLRR